MYISYLLVSHEECNPIVKRKTAKYADIKNHHLLTLLLSTLKKQLICSAEKEQLECLTSQWDLRRVRASDKTQPQVSGSKPISFPEPSLPLSSWALPCGSCTSRQTAKTQTFERLVSRYYRFVSFYSSFLFIYLFFCNFHYFFVT